MNHDSVERELKLVPLEPRLLDQLWRLASPPEGASRLSAARNGARLGDFEVHSARRELQRNSFFDTPARALSGARVGFRRRTIAGQALATWTLKADAALVRGLAVRTEIELRLDADMPPALALGALRDAARSRGAAALAETVADALAGRELPLARPFLEMETDRRILDLELPERGWSVELALDRVRLLGHDYAEAEIEAELRRGDDAALESARAAISALDEVRDSEGSKLSRALAHLATCSCATVSS